MANVRAVGVIVKRGNERVTLIRTESRSMIERKSPGLIRQTGEFAQHGTKELLAFAEIEMGKWRTEIPS